MIRFHLLLRRGRHFRNQAAFGGDREDIKTPVRISDRQQKETEDRREMYKGWGDSNKWIWTDADNAQ